MAHRPDEAVPKVNYAGSKQKAPARNLSPWMMWPVFVTAAMALLAMILAVAWGWFLLSLMLGSTSGLQFASPNRYR